MRCARFTLCILFLWSVGTGAWATGPEVFQVLDPVRPDETLLLFGADFSPDAKAEGIRLQDRPVDQPPARLVTNPPGEAISLEILARGALSLKVLVPKFWKPGVYAVRMRNKNGRASSWLFANRPRIWWHTAGFGGRACAGGQLRLFGKNLGKASRVWLVDSTGQAKKLRIIAARDNDVVTVVPRGAKPGCYKLWVHNGFGGMSGFGDPATVEIGEPENWPDSVFDVCKYGAKGDGSADDTKAIRRALDAARVAGGGTVYLPPGVYVVTGRLVVPPRTRVWGEDRRRTRIMVPVFWPSRPERLPEFDTVFTGDGDFAIENLTIVARGVRRLIACPDVPSSFAPGMVRWGSTVPAAPRVAIRSLRLEHLYFSQRVTGADPRRQVEEGPTTIALRGEDCSIEECEVISSGMPLQLTQARRARIIGNVFRTGRTGWIGFWGMSESLVEDNDFSAGDLEGGYAAVHGPVENVLFRGNRWHDGYGLEREALTFDTPYLPIWIGSLTPNGATDYKVGRSLAGKWPPPSTTVSPLAAVVTAGPGMGQVLPIRETNAEGLVLRDAPVVPLTSASTVAVAALKHRVLIVDNHFADASAAVQLFSSASEFFIARNTAVRTGGSYANAYDSTDPGGNRRFSYAFFNQWLDNVFEESGSFEQGPSREGFLGLYAYSGGEWPGTVAIGNRFVGNRLDTGARWGLRNFAPAAVQEAMRSPAGLDTLFEANTVSRLPVFDRGYQGTLTRRPTSTSPRP